MNDILTKMAEASHSAKCAAYANTRSPTFLTVAEIDGIGVSAALECLADNLPTECVAATTALSYGGGRKPFREELKAAINEIVETKG